MIPDSARLGPFHIANPVHPSASGRPPVIWGRVSTLEVIHSESDVVTNMAFGENWSKIASPRMSTLLPAGLIFGCSHFPRERGLVTTKRGSALPILPPPSSLPSLPGAVCVSAHIELERSAAAAASAAVVVVDRE